MTSSYVTFDILMWPTKLCIVMIVAGFQGLCYKENKSNSLSNDMRIKCTLTKIKWMPFKCSFPNYQNGGRLYIELSLVAHQVAFIWTQWRIQWGRTRGARRPKMVKIKLNHYYSFWQKMNNLWVLIINFLETHRIEENPGVQWCKVRKTHSVSHAPRGFLPINHIWVIVYNN